MYNYNIAVHAILTFFLQRSITLKHPLPVPHKLLNFPYLLKHNPQLPNTLQNPSFLPASTHFSIVISVP